MVFAVAHCFAQVSPTLNQAKSAFTSRGSVGRITLDGTFTSAEGSRRQEGNAHLVVNSDGTYSVALSKSIGAAGESRSRTDDATGCTWADPQGNSHPIEFFNCIAPAWFLPELPILVSSEATPEWTLSSQTTEGLVPHLKFEYKPAGGQEVNPSPALDLELSSATLLPTKAKFNLHPDGKSYVNIQVEVVYEDYRQVRETNIPFHIQKFVNGTLVIDISINSATVN